MCTISKCLITLFSWVIIIYIKTFGTIKLGSPSFERKYILFTYSHVIEIKWIDEIDSIIEVADVWLGAGLKYIYRMSRHHHTCTIQADLYIHSWLIIFRVLETAKKSQKVIPKHTQYMNIKLKKKERVVEENQNFLLIIIIIQRMIFYLLFFFFFFWQIHSKDDCHFPFLF